MTSRSPTSRFPTSRYGISVGLVVLAALSGCSQPTQQDIPNRVLDRPTDVALVCARVDCFDADGDGDVDAGECKTKALPLDSCANDSGSCVSDVVYDEFGIYDEGYAHILGFIANSERNEISIFTQCSDELIDLDVDVPGYNFVPAGVLPTHIESSDDGCRVVSSNLGSCDLTVLDGEGFAAFGLDIREGGLSDSIVSPSELVTTLVPQRYDLDAQRWVPLSARPGELKVVPNTLSTAPDNLLDDGGIDECSPGKEGSVYVSFPSCGLVAEIDILTGHILQSVQLETQDDGTVEVVPTGSSPICSVECPGQLEPGDPLPGVLAPSEFNPQALELLVSRIDETDDPREEEPDRSLFVGGLGSDWLIELRIDVDGTWIDDQVQQLELANASGINRIRVSPVVEGEEGDGDDDLRFLYVIAGDGSTRVIGRPPDPNADAPIGTECDTQRDPSTISPTDPNPMCRPASEDDIERRALAQGPGLRAPNGADVTDWAFFEFSDASQGSESTDTPIVQQGTFALGTTTQGRLVYVMIDAPRVLEDQTVETITDESDPVRLMSVELPPHSFLPDPDLDPLPLVEDAAPSRTFPVDYDVARLLAPSLRLVDSAYLDDPLDPDSSLLDNQHRDQDLLAAEEELRGSPPLYANYVPRIAVHDYRSWVQSDWELQWEGILVGTSSTGRVACDTPGWEGGTCRVEEPDDARIHDAAAKFCDAGVLPGDKLVILGCTEDDQCGTGRRCLRETAGGGESTGICVSEQAYDESSQTLRSICAPFLHDACGEAYREYTITKAFQDELWIQAMDIPAQSTVQLVENEDGTLVAEELVGAMICAEEQPETDCVDDGDCAGLDYEGRLVSTSGDEEYPWQCVEARCRRPCEDAQECMLRPLPGPTCFAEFIPYQVRLRNAFYVDGPFGTLDAVVADSVTGECERNEAVGLSPLLTSRIPLPATSSPDDPDWNAIPVCPLGTDVLPTDPNPCRISSTSYDELFHQLVFAGEVVDALRYSTPSFSLILDLTSLEVLVAEIPESDGTRWSGEFATYRRSRIPRGYTQEFGLESGYTPQLANGALNSYALTLPVRLVPSPEPFAVYIVDASGPGTSSGIRGQILRFLADTGSIDTTFDGVR